MVLIGVYSAPNLVFNEGSSGLHDPLPLGNDKGAKPLVEISHPGSSTNCVTNQPPQVFAAEDENLDFVREPIVEANGSETNISLAGISVTTTDDVASLKTFMTGKTIDKMYTIW